MNLIPYPFEGCDIWMSLRDFLLTGNRLNKKLTNPIIDSYFEWHLENDVGLIKHKKYWRSKKVNK